LGSFKGIVVTGNPYDFFDIPFEKICSFGFFLVLAMLMDEYIKIATIETSANCDGSIEFGFQRYKT